MHIENNVLCTRLVCVEHRFRLVPAAEKLPRQILLVIFDSQGNILARSRDAERFVGTNVLGQSEIVTLAVTRKRGTAESAGIERVHRFYGFTPVAGTDWTVLAGIDADYALADARENAITSAMVGGGIVLLVLVLALLLSRRIARPILTVSSAARQVGEGQFNLRVPVEGPQEVVEVAGQFNAMLDAIGRTQAALQNSEQRLKMALDGSRMVIWDLEMGTGSLYLSETWSELMGGPKLPTEVPLRELLRSVPVADRAQLRKALRAVIHAGRDEFAAEHRIHHPQGQVLWMAVTGRVTARDAQGRATRLLGVLVDISERKLREAEIHKLAYFDSLTGLPNRRLLQQQVAQEIARVRRGGLMGALMFIDLDRFKSINDARGHATGDALLKTVATRLRSLVRECDTVARMGGDEFVVLLPGLADNPADAARLARLTADKLREALHKPYLIDAQSFTSSASIGVVLVEPLELNCDDLLREADTAMYRAKAAGRNQTAFFHADMQVEVENRLTMENDLAHAIDRQQLSLYAQPQVDHSGATVGAELLLRWHHPVLGAVSPAKFIPIAEETGSILRIGDWVLEQACLLSDALRARGLQLPLSINVSPRQFRQPDFALNVQAVLLSRNTPTHSLIFEVTESLLLDDVETTLAQMHLLAGIGIRFSVDDFGTGYSSLSYLHRLPLYELKIDKSFVDGTPDELHDTEIVQMVMSLARMLDLRVVAEGVETPRQAEFLRSRGCDAMQGYLFAKPMPVAQWLAAVSPDTPPQDGQ